MRYKIIYHVGKELTLKTKVNSGTLTFQNDSICISGSSPLTVSLSEVTNVEMFRLHGLGRMIKLFCKERTIFLTVVRLNLFGYFVIINFSKLENFTKPSNKKFKRFSFYWVLHPCSSVFICG
jgi:hypothetical protein